MPIETCVGIGLAVKHVTFEEWLRAAQRVALYLRLRVNSEDVFAITDEMRAGNQIPVFIPEHLTARTAAALVDNVTGLDLIEEGGFIRYADSGGFGAPRLELVQCHLHPDKETWGCSQRILRERLVKTEKFDVNHGNFLDFQGYCVLFSMYYMVMGLFLDADSRTMTPERTLTLEPVISMRFSKRTGSVKIFSIDSSSLDPEDGYRAVTHVPLKKQP